MNMVTLLIAWLTGGWIGFGFGLDYGLPRRRISPFLWGLLNPFGPPPVWWPAQRRAAWYAEHGYPWISDDAHS